MKKEKSLLVTLDEAREWYNKGGELKELALRCFSEEDLLKDPLPKTWEECLRIYRESHEGEYIKDDSEIQTIIRTRNSSSCLYDRNIMPSGMSEPMLALMQLLICREVYRNGWKPNFDEQDVYVIYNSQGRISTNTFISQSTILSFQTPEVHDTFLENFKDLIEEAKELI